MVKLKNGVSPEATGEAAPCNRGDPLQNEYQTDDPAERQSAGDWIVERKDTGNGKQDAQCRKPTPATDAEALKIKGTDKPADTAEQQPHAEDERQRQHGKGLVAEQENCQQNREDTVHQEPAGAKHKALRGSKYNDIHNAGKQHSKSQHQ